jgi:hypothetical protein
MPAIGCKIKALRHQPLGTKSKHRAASHWVQNQSIALPAIRHKIKASFCQPSGAKSTHYTASHRAQNQSIVPPAVGRKFDALHRQPSGANPKHCATIRRSNSALQRHWVQIISIAPPLDTSFKYRATIGCFFQASCHCVNVSSIIAPLSCAASCSRGTSKPCIIAPAYCRSRIEGEQVTYFCTGVLP